MDIFYARVWNTLLEQWDDTSANTVCSLLRPAHFYSRKEPAKFGPHLGAMLYDIGKTKISIEVLQKPGKLASDEWNSIKKHPEYGFGILRRCHEISLPSAHCAFQHHERIDGTGYTRGLKEKEIHPFAKIIAVANVYGAVTSNRSYSKAILPHEGMELIFSGSQTLFVYIMNSGVIKPLP